MGPEVLLLIVGLAGLWLGSGVTIDGAIRIARELKISKLFVGLTILSIGTSLPEIFTHISASLSILQGIEASGVAIGTNIGSNILQITFILGLVGLFAVIKSSPKIQRRDGLVMLGAIVLLWLLGFDGHISRLEGLVLAGLYIIYLYWISRDEKEMKELIRPHHKMLDSKKDHIFVGLGKVVLGLVILLLSANWVVDNSLFLAQAFSIDQTFIGLLLVGISTSLPELTIALRGIQKGAKKMSLGVLIGSNITNPMLALGLGAMISGLTMGRVIEYFDLPLLFVVSVIALLFFHRKHELKKPEAVVLLLLYIGYIAYKVYGVL